MSAIDFHAHILPKADHGSADIETSLFQLAAAEAVGMTTIVATPHFYPDHHHAEDFLSRRARSMRELTAAYKGAINLVLGAEVLLCEGLVHLPQLPQLCVAGTNVLLIEMPMTSWTRRHMEALVELRDEGRFTIVLAHVDRYPSKSVAGLLEQDFLAQLNVENICRFRGRKQLLRWVSEGKIVALGSDVHGKSNAYTKFQRACTILGEDTRRVMAHTEQLLRPISV